jgi:hypothetical protein
MTSFVRALVAAAALLSSTGANAAQTVYGNWYEDNASINCSTPVAQCSLYFSATPDVVRIKRLSCYVDTAALVRRARLAVATTSGGLSTRTVFFEITSMPASASQHYYQANQEVDFTVGSGRFPFILFASDGATVTWTVECIISGDAQPMQHKLVESQTR